MGSRIANRLCLHVIRVILAHAITQVRWWLLAGLLPGEERQRFHRDGFLVVENFLPEDQFLVFEQEIRGYKGKAWEMVQGDTLTQQILLDYRTLKDFPVTAQVLESKRYLRLLSYTGSTFARPRMFIQRIVNGYAGSRSDPQKTYHADTFHPTMKAWLFLDDVAQDRGAFTYIPGSHRLTWRRLRWEYRQGLAARDSDNSHVRAGSFRFYPEDLAELGFSGIEPAAVRKNTLVLANTFGIHRRGPARGKVQRLELWAMSRKNPFFPWPGLGTYWYSRLEARVKRHLVAVGEARAAAKGKRATWTTVDVDFGTKQTGS
jgi:hypothetical protein